MSGDALLGDFVAMSAELTAFSPFELRGTGLAEAYFGTMTEVLGEDLVAALLAAWRDIAKVAPPGADGREALLRRRLFGDERLGPIARNVMKLWYIGIWYELPRAWTERYGALPRNVSFLVSGQAYAEGLLWTAIGAHPPGAKAQGYGSWAGPPQIPSPQP